MSRSVQTPSKASSLMVQELLSGSIRLQKFEGPWKRTTFGELVEIRRGSVLTRAQAGRGVVPIVAGGRSPAGFTDKANRWGRTITISASGASAGFVSLYNRPIFASDCSTISNANHYDLDFIYYSLVSRQQEIYRAQTGGAQPHIHARDIYPIEISVPREIEEQRAIAQVLQGADQEIAALERLIVKKQAIKQGMMQELLTGRIRVSGYRTPWCKRKIGEFTTVKAGGTPSTSVPHYWGGQIRWMRSEEIHQKRVCEVIGRITESGLRESSAQLLPAKSVLIALAGQGKTRGTVAVSEVELSTNQSIAGILPSEDHDPNYLYYNLDFRYSELRRGSTGDGGRGGLNLTIIKAINVPMPRIEEQRAIAQVLQGVDQEIAALERCLAKAREIKTGMMQELLSGRTRLPIEEVSS